jgi:F0F1-type ATP synthase membrane subunit b/b'
MIRLKALLDTNIGQQSIIFLLWQILLTRLEVKVLKQEQLEKALQEKASEIQNLLTEIKKSKNY